MVEKDYNYPGGFYIRHKDASRYCIACTRHDLENMIENALAALGVNCGRIILHDDAELQLFNDIRAVIMEELDNKLIFYLESNGFKNAIPAKQFFMQLLWVALSSARVNERVPKIELELGKGGRVGIKDIIGTEQQNGGVALDIINSSRGM